MKVTIVRACGHEEIVKVFGSAKQREAKLKWMANYDCEDCKKAEKAAGCKEIKMHYSEYKTNYADCATKKGSYDKKSKTIVVYVPTNVVYVPTKEKIEIVDTVTTKTVETNMMEANESPKYNKSDIMKRAWELYRNAKGSFSDCLKYAWAESKGIVKKLISADIPEALTFQAISIGAKILKERLEYAKANLMHINNSQRACNAIEKAIEILG